MLRAGLYDPRAASVLNSGPKVSRILQRGISGAPIQGPAADVAPATTEVPLKPSSYARRRAPMEALLRSQVSATL